MRIALLLRFSFNFYYHLSLSLPPLPFLLTPAFDEEFPSGTITDVVSYCPDTSSAQPSNSNSAVVALLAVFIVLLIILIAVSVVVGVMFFVCYRNMKNLTIDKLDNEVTNSGGHFVVDSGIAGASNLYSDVRIRTPESAPQQSRKSSISR